MRQGYPAHTCGARQKRGTTHGTPAHATADGHRTSRGGMRRLGHSVCTRRGPRGRPRTTRSAKSRHECSSRPRTCVRECDACVWPCRACMRWQSRRERLSVRMRNGRASLADPARPAAPVDRPVRVRAYGIACARACVWHRLCACVRMASPVRVRVCAMLARAYPLLWRICWGSGAGSARVRVGREHFAWIAVELCETENVWMEALMVWTSAKTPSAWADGRRKAAQSPEQWRTGLASHDTFDCLRSWRYSSTHPRLGA
jgi:hypothetical protein